VPMFNSMRALVMLVGLLAPADMPAAAPFQSPTNHRPSSSSWSSSTTKNTDRAFTWVLAGEGVLEGVHTNLDVYKAPDGGRVEMVTAHFATADAARSAQEKLNRSAVKILKREDLLDRSAKVVGERSVVTLVDKDRKKSTAIIVTMGTEFREYASYSEQDALAFEKYAKLS
jgi:hypothetical protein